MKKLYSTPINISIILIFVSFNLFSQTDGCSSPTSLTVGSSCTTTSFAVNTDGTTQDANASCATGTAYEDSWFSVIGTGNSMTITITGTNRNACLAAFTSCASGQIACQMVASGATTNNSITFATTVATTYFIQIQRRSGNNTANLSGNICAVSAPAGVPANDLVCNAITTTCGNSYTGTTVNSTTTGETSLPACSNTSPGAPGVWYKFVGDGSAVTASLCTGTSYDTKMNVYTGSACGTLTTCIGSDDDGCGSQSTVTFSTTTGTVYYILVNGYSSATGTFSLAISCVSPPTNDLVCDAITVTCGNSYTGTTVGTTSTGETALPSCGTSPDAPGVWYKFVGNGSVVTASLCTGTSYDTKINIYSGASCGALSSCIASNDDNCGSQSSVSFGANTGTTYYILVNGYSSATGTFGLAISCCTPSVTACATLNTPANGATNVGSCSNLTWTAPSTTGCSGVDSYDVYFGTTTPPPFYANTSSTSFPVGLMPSTTYYWQIRPKNASGTPSGCTIRTFSSSSAGNPQYTLADDAASPSPYDCVTLTTAANDQRGCAWDINSTLNFAANFSYDFTVNLGSSDAGADGMAFVMQNDSQGRCKCGTTGGAIGAGGISNSVIIEIDTYINTEDRDDFSPMIGCSGSEDPDHLDIWYNGNINPDTDYDCNAIGTGERPATPLAVRLKNGATNYNIENGNNHILRIAWNAGSSTLTAQVLNTALSTTYGTISSTFNPLTIFGTNTPYFGFTASTGGLNNNQSFCNPPTLLPVELASFHSYCFGGSRKIYWTTLSENNNDYFILERSENGINYAELQKFPADILKTTGNEYEFQDFDNYASNNYYRLVQVDKNGVKRFYDAIYAECNAENQSLTINSIQQNEEQEIQVNIFATQNLEHELVLFDYMGRIVYQNALLLNKGANKIVINNTNFSSGLYFATIKNVISSASLKCFLK